MQTDLCWFYKGNGDKVKFNSALQQLPIVVTTWQIQVFLKWSAAYLKKGNNKADSEGEKQNNIVK